jgi:tRNA-dihydrouridine synthase A
VDILEITAGEAKVTRRDDQSAQPIDRKLSVAPMMDWTDRHCRYFLRSFSPRVLLYTEMMTAAAVTRGQRERLLRFSPEEQPVALQLGGSDPAELAAAARAGEQQGYLEINLNCGCPSDRVHAGAFGACLMLTPARVARAVAAMRAAVALPVTVKMRIGVVEGEGGRARVQDFDEADYARLHGFTAGIAAAGCDAVIVHARKAVLGGLSPRENREVPPLRYDVVRRLRQDFPQLMLIVNGGLRTAAQVQEALGGCDGVMLGREAYHRPYVLAELHRQLFADGWSIPDRAAVLERMEAYATRETAAGEPLQSITRHMLGLFAGQPGARRYRALLSHGARDARDARRLLREAAALAA